MKRTKAKTLPVEFRNPQGNWVFTIHRNPMKGCTHCSGPNPNLPTDFYENGDGAFECIHCDKAWEYSEFDWPYEVGK